MAKAPVKKAQFKLGDYSLTNSFNGYVARKDPTTLDSSFMIAPSKNVIIGTSGRPRSVQGYTLDGAGSSTIDSGIRSNFDFDNFKGDRRNLRTGFLTTANNDGKLQFRYGTTPTWIDLKTSLTSVNLCFTTFSDITEKIKLLLWVDGSGNVFEWNGAVTTIASVTANTITKQGTLTWTQEGFYTTRDKKIKINGVEYTYTGGESTTTLTGVTPNPTSVTITAGDVAFQSIVTTAMSGLTSMETTFLPTVVGSGKDNQLYMGSNISNNQYISKVNNYKDFSFTSPTRVAGEGMLLRLKAPPVKYIAQESQDSTQAYDMYISSGQNNWQVVRSTLSTDNTKEKLELIDLKIAPLQGARSERLATKMKNHIIFLGNDNVANFLGYMSQQFVPVMTDFSYQIIDDMNSYDFTDASMFYHRNYIYLAIPKHGIVRIYNMTDQTKNQAQYSVEQIDQQSWFWEAPISYPLSGFYVVNGELYGHGYNTSESYKLFTGGSFNGQDIDCNATFAYDDKGDRTQTKNSNEIWVEGYIKQNTTLTIGITGDLGYFQDSIVITLSGINSKLVSYGASGGSLGTVPLGKNPLGGTSLTTTTLPSWFHGVKTYKRVPYYLEQISFSTKGVDLEWQLICFGTNAEFTSEGNNFITD